MERSVQGTNIIIMISKKMLVGKLISRPVELICIGALLLITAVPAKVQGLSSEQKGYFAKSIKYFDEGRCSSSSEVTSGSGEPDGSVFPDLDPEVMAGTIDKFIKKENPNSKLNGLGETIVAGAKNSNINPFLIVAQAYMESGLADPGISDIFDRGNNAFGRSALISQPHIVSQGAPGAPGIWYKWSSVKASVDYTAHENKNAAGGGDIASYLREQYGNILDKGDLDAYIAEYAPDGNEDTYVKNISGWVKEMARLASGRAAPIGAEPEASGSGGCCSTSGSGTGGDESLVGGTNGEKAFLYFVGKGLSAEAAAGIIGNFMVESGGLTENLDTRASNGTHTGIAQWDNGGRWASLVDFAKGKSLDPYSLFAQLEWTWQELSGSYSGTLNSLKKASSPEDAATEFEATFEISGGSALADREASARKIFNQYGGGVSGSVASSGECSGTPAGDANLQKTITVSTKGKFITLPSKYSCPGHTTRIDSRVAADLAYLITTYNMCAEDGLASGHNSHGAGISVDLIPKSGNSKNDWENSTEAAARAIGWFGDGANDPIGSKKGCAFYNGDYGQCMHIVYPDKFPKWMRWIGYNGDYCHGDPWHYQNACEAHLHISWDSPNGNDATSPTEIAEPIPEVYVFPTSIPSDLEGLIN